MQMLFSVVFRNGIDDLSIHYSYPVNPFNIRNDCWRRRTLRVPVSGEGFEGDAVAGAFSAGAEG